ncbi:MAG: response regulator transcription factor [Caldilineaceae bacterium]
MGNTVDDHEIVRRGLRMTILAEEDMELIAEAANGQEALALLERSVPDLLLLDLQMPVMDGVETARIVKERYPQVYVLVLTSFDGEDKLHAAMQAGVDGYFLKDTPGDELVAAMRASAKGQPLLHPESRPQTDGLHARSHHPTGRTQRSEREVLQHLAHGMTTKKSAAPHLTEQTIKGYVSTASSPSCRSTTAHRPLLAVRYELVRIEDLTG